MFFFGASAGRPISPVDALFTATSAVCVTGLTVVGTDQLPLASQITIPILIQLGGLGVMTAVTASFLLTGRRVGHYQRLLFTSSIGLDSQAGAVRLVRWIIASVFIIEGIGACCLWILFCGELPPGHALWNAVFHSVSAFCNAGFSLFPDNLASWHGSGVVPVVIACLIVIGGMGFIVLLDVALRLLRRRKTLSAHSRMVLWTTAVLLAGGSLLLWASSWSSGASWSANLKRLPEAMFMSVSARTAGFNIAPMTNVTSVGAFILCLLMLVGASPGSTGGGLKTTTVAVLAMTAIRETQGVRQVTVGRGGIPQSTINLSITLAVLYLSSIGTGIIVLGLVEPLPLKNIVFDAFSALGTVGLSLGDVGRYSPAGKLVLTLLMFWGRVGLLTFAYGLFRKSVSETGVTYPDASIPIG